MITISLDDLSLFIVLIVLGISIYTLFVARRTEERVDAQIKAFQNAPILRQYVEKFVPIDDTAMAREIKAKAMIQSEIEFEKAYGLGDLDGKKPAKRPIFAKGLNGAPVAIAPEDTV